MTRVFNAPEDFADEALEGFVAAHRRYARRVHGGVVRSTRAPDGQVAVVIGGGTGHYPAFSGWLGPGLAHGIACGNIFSSPAVAQVYSVCKAAHRGGGIWLSFGNYAGDVLHFGHAAERLRGEGIDVRVLPITDDIASGPADHPESRRGIAGDLTVFKVAGAAAEAGYSLDEVDRVARRANDRTRTMGVAFDGCTLPGADHPLFAVEPGTMSIGLGIHGEPGIQTQPLGTAEQIATSLVDAVLAEAPGDSDRVAVLFNGLGTCKYEELFVAYRTVAAALAEAGMTIVGPEVGEQCTSLDMAGLSLTVMYLDEELERLWLAPVDTPALRRGAIASHGPLDEDELDEEPDVIAAGSAHSHAFAQRVSMALHGIQEILVDNESMLGDIDAVAGDGDHGIGMTRGIRAAVRAADEAVAAGAGARTTLARAGDAWSERAGGTSGALWGAALNALASVWDDEVRPAPQTAVSGAQAVLDALTQIGGAQAGDKTMMDAVIPYVAALKAHANGPLAGSLRVAADAAHAGAMDTANYAARLGRAKTHGDKSIGTPDAGAVSFALIVGQLADDLEGES